MDFPAVSNDCRIDLPSFFSPPSLLCILAASSLALRADIEFLTLVASALFAAAFFALVASLAAALFLLATAAFAFLKLGILPYTPPYNKYYTLLYITPPT
jgi:hypothetical protein